jgi:hypothetical protein
MLKMDLAAERIAKVCDADLNIERNSYTINEMEMMYKISRTLTK